MKVDCPHWQDCGIKHGGCCAIGKFDKPSFGTCNIVCLGKLPAPHMPAFPPAPAEVAAARLALCNVCGENVDGVCQELKRLKGSACAAKVSVGVRRADAHCPLTVPKWIATA